MAGLRLAESIAANPETGSLVGLCDINEQVLSSTLPRANALRSQDAIDLLKIINLEALVIAIPDNQHYELLIAALDAGVNVFCEKPVVTTRSELDSLHARLSSTSLTLGTNTILRTAQRFRDLKELIQNGELGEIATFSASYIYGRVQKFRDGWRGSYAEYSPTLGGGIHMLDLLNYLFESRPLSVIAKRSNRGANALSLDFHDTATALMTYPNGLIGTLSSVFATAHPHHHFLRIEGTRGTFENRPSDAAEIWNSSSEPSLLNSSGRVPDKGIVLQSFLASLRDGRKPLVSTEEALNALSAAIAIEESMQEEREIAVPYYDSLTK
jgi:predicted dehydrogenase